MKKQTSPKAFFSAVSNAELEKADLMLSGGINVNVRYDGMTALHMVVKSRTSLPAFRWLLKHHALLDERDDLDLTPLMIACGRDGAKARQMALELIEAGCDAKARRKSDGMSAIEFASESSVPEVVLALLDHGASIDGPRGCLLSPAMMAVRGDKVDNLRTLVERGCDLKKGSGLSWARGMTCLGLARLENSNSVVKYLERIGAP